MAHSQDVLFHHVHEPTWVALISTQEEFVSLEAYARERGLVFHPDYQDPYGEGKVVGVFYQSKDGLGLLACSYFSEFFKDHLADRATVMAEDFERLCWQGIAPRKFDYRDMSGLNLTARDLFDLRLELREFYQNMVLMISQPGGGDVDGDGLLKELHERFGPFGFIE